MYPCLCWVRNLIIIWRPIYFIQIAQNKDEEQILVGKSQTDCLFTKETTTATSTTTTRMTTRWIQPFIHYQNGTDVSFLLKILPTQSNIPVIIIIPFIISPSSSYFSTALLSSFFFPDKNQNPESPSSQ